MVAFLKPKSASERFAPHRSVLSDPVDVDTQAQPPQQHPQQGDTRAQQQQQEQCELPAQQQRQSPTSKSKAHKAVVDAEWIPM